MEPSKNKPQKKEPDLLVALKYRGYCRAHSPPGEIMDYDDLVRSAKFFLCKHAKRLWKDPIWDEYTDEEILIEYYSYVFTMDEESRKKFEVQIDAGTQIYGEDIFDWLDRKVQENQRENAKKLEEMPQKVSFSPETNEDLEE